MLQSTSLAPSPCRLQRLFGVEALSFRLADSAASVIITDAAGLAKLRKIEARPEGLRLLLCVDGAEGDALDLAREMRHAAPDFTPRDTLADEPAL